MSTTFQKLEASADEGHLVATKVQLFSRQSMHRCTIKAPYRLLLLGVGVALVVVVVGGVGLAPGGLGAVGATARLCLGTVVWG